MIDFKDIHIGEAILLCVKERDIDSSRICSFMRCSEDELHEIYKSRSICTDVLLRMSKLLEYDFFRLYSQHLILYVPQISQNYARILPKTQESALPQFRKNIYSQEIIDFMLELIKKGEKTRFQVIDEYGVPKTTLYRWIAKSNKNQ